MKPNLKNRLSSNMTLFMFYIFNLSCAAIINKLEASKGIYPTGKNLIMGTWPYNLVAIIGLGALAFIENSILIYLVFGLTGLFYLCAALKISLKQSNKG